MKKKWVLKRHKFWYLFFKLPSLIYMKLKYHFIYKKLKFDRKKHYFILSNHQTDLDSIMLFLSLRRPLYTLATDTLLSSGFAAKFLTHAFGVIPKRKGVSDSRSIKLMLEVAKENGDIMVFPEGNRSYAEFLYPIDESLIKLIKKCNLPIMVLNIHGGFGISPRFSNTKRKGKLYVELKEIIQKEEYDNIDNNILLERIKDDLKVYDSTENQLFKSNKRAEYLERMLFVCPCCKNKESLISDGNYISCACGLKVEYKENLHLEGNLDTFKFNILNDWYNYQKEWLKEYEVKDDIIIFSDEDIKLYKSIPYKKRKLLTCGKLIVTKDYLIFNDTYKYNVSDIKMASPISGTKFYFTHNEDSFLVIGNDRFNSLKYVLLFNKLDTKMKNNDIYYTIYDKEK